MNDNQLQSPHHQTTRTALRIAGPVVALVGLGFTVVGIGSFFSSFGTFEPPRYFWCAFIGLPLLAVGLMLCQAGYVGAIYRYFAGEAAPVVKDTANYLGEGAQPGIKAAAKAAAEGIREGLQPPQPPE